MRPTFFHLTLLVCLSVALAPFAGAQTPTTDQTPGDSWIEATFTLTQPDLTHLELAGELIIREYVVDGERLTADEIAEAYLGVNRYQGNAKGAEFITDVENDIAVAVAASLKRSFPAPAVVTVGAVTLDRTTLEDTSADGNEFDPGLRVTLTASVVRELDLGGLSTEALSAVFDAGAIINGDMSLTADAGYAVTYIIHAPASPAGLAFANVGGATASANGATITATAENLDGNGAPVMVTYSLQNPVAVAAKPTAEDVGLGITLDLKDLDISIGKALGGDLGGVLMDIRIRAALGVIEVPAEVASQLGNSVKLDYLSSDAIRLLMSHGVIKTEDIDKMEKELLDQINEKLAGALGGTIAIKGGFDRATLDASLVGDVLTGEKPLVFTATTSIMKPLSGGPPTQAALSLYTAPAQTFELPSIQGRETTYKFILPAGLALADLQVSGGASERGTESDGRDSFTVTPSGGTATASVAMSVTAGFVIAKFWPVLLLAIIIIFALIGTPIALIALRRRKAKKE